MAVIQFEMSKRTCFNDAQLTVVDGCTILYKHEEVLHRDTTQWQTEYDIQGYKSVMFVYF